MGGSIIIIVIITAFSSWDNMINLNLIDRFINGFFTNEA
jgi:hypothetical protein